MTMTPDDISKALVALCMSQAVPVQDACDAALKLLNQQCPGVSMSAFKTLVEELVSKHETIHHARLTTPDEQPAQIQLHGKVDLTKESDPSILGGAVLVIDDTRIDASVKHALEELHTLCVKPIS